MNKEKEKSKEDKSLTITGYVGKDGIQIKDVEVGQKKEQKKVANFQIATGPKENVKWYDVAVWGELTDKLKDLGKGSKLTVSGEMKTNSYQNDKGETVNRPYMNAKEVSVHQLMEISGNVGAIEHKDKYTDIKLYENRENEKPVLYNVRAFGDDMKALSEVNVGDKLNIKVDAQFRDYEKGGEMLTAINATVKEVQGIERNQEKNSEQKQDIQAEIKQENSKVEGKENSTVKEKSEKKDKAEKKTKSKGDEVSM